MSEIYRLAISPHARMQNYRDFNSPYAYGTVPYAYGTVPYAYGRVLYVQLGRSHAYAHISNGPE